MIYFAFQDTTREVLVTRDTSNLQKQMISWVLTTDLIIAFDQNRAENELFSSDFILIYLSTLYLFLGPIAKHLSSVSEPEPAFLAGAEAWVGAGAGARI